MGQILSVRTAAVGLAVVVVSFISFPSLPSASLFSLVSPISVDRALKGDRLPLTVRVDKAQMPTQTVVPTQSMMPTQSAQSRTPIPVGCDRAFSPISAPRLANVFGRCSV
jgi:hypothetical protein